MIKETQILSFNSFPKAYSLQAIDTVLYYTADVISATDYYPFGSPIPGRSLEGDGYRFGFNSQEKDNEIYGNGNSHTAEFWQYDARLGRRWNVDPVVKYHESPYACFANNPLLFIDPNGADTITDLNGDNYNVGEGYSISDDKSVLYGGGLKTKFWDPNATSMVNPNEKGSFVDYNPNEIKSGENISSLSGLIWESLKNNDRAIIQGNLLEKFENDPALIDLFNSQVEQIKNDDRYSNQAFKVSFETKWNFCFGGNTSESPMMLQGMVFLIKPKLSVILFPKTWNVASNPTTWAARHVNLHSYATVSATGHITVRYWFEDKLDLRPHDNKWTPYNITTFILGGIYHDLFNRTDQLKVNASWVK